MKLYSTNDKSIRVSLKEAITRGLAEDGGLYMPTEIPVLPAEFFANIQNLSFQEQAYTVAQALIGDDIPKEDLRLIVNDAVNFPAPVVNIHQNIHTLELFHGPTLAFKDFGGRFMSRLLGYFIKDSDQEITILAATSGDTGSAVASGFLGIPNTKVVLLYPAGKVSKIQEQQLTTMGQNVTALEISGTFDDCQKLVKQAFNDQELRQKRNLTSANSINIGRLIPQSFYYFHAYSQIKDQGKPVAFCVPSGNFGNITAGLFAKKMGLPVEKLIAATNQNDSFPRYLETGEFSPQPSKETISNAMDVGNPSNFARISDLYNNNLQAIKQDIESKSYNDDQTAQALKDVYQNHGYTMDPHGAVGYLGLTDYLKNHPETLGIFLETAHPAKFLDVVEPIINQKIQIPERLAICLEKEKQAIKMEADYSTFKDYLTSSA